MTQDVIRMMDIAARWSEPGQWEYLRRLTEHEHRTAERATHDALQAECWEGDVEADRLRESSAIYLRASEEAAGITRELRAELTELRETVEKHVPHLGHLLPVALIDALRHAQDMRRLRAALADLPQTQDAGTSNSDLTLEAKALALLLLHPDWRDQQIADAVPCNRTTLYRWSKFKAARKAASGTLPAGSKTADGDMEAWEN